MAILLLLHVIFVVEVSSAYNEEPCVGLGGLCQRTSTRCAGGAYLSGKCPTQPGNVRCCKPDVEASCSSLGGTCRFTSTSCPGGGNFVSGKCPDQPNDVRCCVPASVTCSSLGGTCRNFATCSGISVSRLCPGSSAVRCCVNPPGVDLVDKHINKEEGGLYLQGYIPTSGSGVTIATGVDLGQQSRSILIGMGVPSSGGALLAKLDPYLGLRTRAAVHAAGLDEKDLRLTLDEGLQLNAAFKRALMNRIAPYDDRLSDRGTAVLASISHWCYNVVDRTPDNKCYISGCPNYLRDALLGGGATDADLRAALASQKGCAVRKGRPSWVRNRLQSEINFLQ